MNYELALKLKEAGFPQRSDFIITQGDNVIHCCYDGVKANCYCPRCTDGMYENEISDYAVIPTISELIEACGEEFESLTQWDDGWHANSKGILRHDMVDEEFPEPIRCDSGCCGTHTKGSSPEEAVANLWLELTKNKK